MNDRGIRATWKTSIVPTALQNISIPQMKTRIAWLTETGPYNIRGTFVEVIYDPSYTITYGTDILPTPISTAGEGDGVTCHHDGSFFKRDISKV